MRCCGGEMERQGRHPDAADGRHPRGGVSRLRVEPDCGSFSAAGKSRITSTRGCSCRTDAGLSVEMRPSNIELMARASRVGGDSTIAGSSIVPIPIVSASRGTRSSRPPKSERSRGAWRARAAFCDCGAQRVTWLVEADVRVRADAEQQQIHPPSPTISRSNLSHSSS